MINKLSVVFSKSINLFVFLWGFQHPLKRQTSENSLVDDTAEIEEEWTWGIEFEVH